MLIPWSTAKGKDTLQTEMAVSLVAEVVVRMTAVAMTVVVYLCCCYASPGANLARP